MDDLIDIIGDIVEAVIEVKQDKKKSKVKEKRLDSGEEDDYTLIHEILLANSHD